MRWIGQNIYDQVSKFRNAVDFSEDVTFYQPVNNADPQISIGSSDDERLQIEIFYQGTTTQSLQQAVFRTKTESGTANDGMFTFSVDEAAILDFKDAGIDLRTGMGIAINGADILTDSSGTATLSNIDALDATTISTFNAALTAGDITGVTAGTNLSGGGTSGAVTINLADASTSAKGAASFSSQNFAASSGAITIKDEGIDLAAEVTGVLPSANMDADTMHLGVVQTITNTKTFDGVKKLQFRDANAYINSPDANDLEIAATDITLDAAGQMYFETDTARFVSDQTNDPLVIIQGEADDATGPRLRFNKKRGADGEDGDSCGLLQWQSFDDGTPSTQIYGQIETTIHDATAGEESGQLEIGVANEDGGMGTGLKLVGGSANNEVDVTVGLGTSSVTTVAGTLTMGSTAALTNAGLVAVANQSNITGVGTISSGQWRGDAIASAYIGDDQVTEDKLADTLLAEIDANTAKATNVTTNLTATTHASQITINSSDGTNVVVAEASGSIAGVMSVSHHDKLDAIEAIATADQTKADIDGLAITTVGTIDTGVWEGTAIASNQLKHLIHYAFSGYAEGNGSTYEIPVVAHDAQAPFEHNTSTGADGTTAISVQNQVRTNAKVMPSACTLKKWTGWVAGEGSGTVNIALFKLTPANDSNSTVSPVLLDEITITASGNSRSFAIAETSFTVATVSAGDIIFTGIKAVSAKDVYFTSTLEIEV